MEADPINNQINNNPKGQIKKQEISQSELHTMKKRQFPTYKNLQQFVNKTRELLRQQQRYQIQKFEQMTQNKTMQEIQAEGFGLTNMLIIGERQGFYGKIILSLIKAYHSQKNPMNIPQQCKMQVGDDVAIYRNNAMIASGVIYKRVGPKLKISIRQQGQEENDYDFQGVNVNVILKWNQITFRRYFYILQELQDHTVFKNSEIIGKFFPEAYQLKNNRPHGNKVKATYCQNMNQEQNIAINQGLTQKVHLIHGPPGTGKTTTVCQLIVQAVKNGQKVLACAPSNIAVDNMVQSLAKRVNCVRIGNPARIIQKVIQRCLDFLITKNTNIWKNQVKKLQATRKRIKKCTSKDEKKKLYYQIKSFQNQIHLLQEQTIQQILNQADVVCCTNVGAADKIFKKYMPKRKFDLVVIDQCGQGLQISCWIPLLRGKRAVLAGDHKQLPPTIQGLNDSLLSYTLFSRAMDQLTNITSTMLLVQYRMNKSIMGWSNKQFYDDRLIAHQSVKNHKLDQMYQNVDPSEEIIMMIDTSGCKMGESGQQNQSKLNIGEADIMIAILKKILDYGVEAKHIAMLTPYSKQVALLKSLIQQNSLQAPDVSTVDGIQGRQKQCILISLVRSNKKRQIGFLKDWRRMNVAVTRARRMLIIVGNADCISKDPILASLVKWIDQNGKIISAKQFQDNPAVRFGQGVSDQQDFNNINNGNEQKKKNKKKKKENKIPKVDMEKPSAYQAHTEDQVKSMKQYYKKVLQQIKTEIVFNGATNFQRKIIHEVAEQQKFCHQTSADKKSIKVWIKVEEPKNIKKQKDREDQDEEEQDMIEVKPKQKNNKKNDEGEKKHVKKIQEKFSSQLHELMGQQSSQQQEEENTKQEQKIQEKQQIEKILSKKKKKNKKQEKKIEENEEDWQKLLDQFDNSAPKKDECFRCKKKITSVTSVQCRFCKICFCRNHVLAQEHGCDQDAKDQARSTRREVDKLVQKGALKIKQKIKQQEQARKRKPKDDKQKGKNKK